MSLWTRVVNVIRGGRLNRELDEELESHIEAAVEHGRDPAEVRRTFGSALRHREKSRDFKIIPWLDALRADVLFGWRQIRKRKVASSVSVLSLALGIGACISAFRIIDAVLLRPLPVADPAGLLVISFEKPGDAGRVNSWDSCSYPQFREWRAAVKDQAELVAVSYAGRTDLTYTSDQEMEKACVQFVSGWMFRAFGLRPELGRVLMEDDDLQPGAHPYAVLSHDYWIRRFNGDPRVLGRKFRMDDYVYEIVGVAAAPFTGTEPGMMTDVFVPTMMHAGAIGSANSFWLRTFVRPKSGAATGALRDRLYSVYRAFELERSKSFVKKTLAGEPRERLLLEPAAAGASGMQKDYRRSLAALGVLVALVLLIACANVANLMTAQAAARAREMALRVSIGAGRWRLVQLVLVESALLSLLAAAVGALFAGGTAPLVVSMINPPDNPVRLLLPADWRVAGFGLVLTLVVTIFFGVVPALRASGVRPVSALKGGEVPRSRHRLMHALVAAQVAFCFLVLFVASLFVATFDRLSSQATGFSSERLLTLETVTQSGQPPVFWDEVAGHLRTLPGVEKVALAGWPLLSGTMRNYYLSIGGAPPTDVLAFSLAVSPGWMETLNIPFLDGRDFRADDAFPGVAIVNETFAKQYFNGVDPIGKSFETLGTAGARTRFQIVGLVGDARYRDLREPMLPVAYVPFQSVDAKGVPQPMREATIIVRTSAADPLALASILRREVPAARPEFRVSNLRTQKEINESHTIRERLLARLALFFSFTALLLAGIGVYGVLDYSVLQRRREIGIRMALGARPGHIVQGVTVDVLWMVCLGGLAGFALGMSLARYVETLLYQVRATDLSMLALPWLAVLAAALAAALVPVIRAVRIDPVKMLRAE